MRAVHALIALLLGMLASVILIVLVFVSGSGVLIEPVVFLGSSIAIPLAKITPGSLVYWLVPDGGGAACVLLVCFSAWVVLALPFATACFYWLRCRTTRPTKGSIQRPEIAH